MDLENKIEQLKAKAKHIDESVPVFVKTTHQFREAKALQDELFRIIDQLQGHKRHE